MAFSSIFGFGKIRPSLPITHGRTHFQLPIAPDHSRSATAETGVNGSQREPTGANGSEIELPQQTWCLPTQAAWLTDPWPLRIWEKSRQVGATTTDALDSVLKASPAGAKFDVWVSSRDEDSACLYLDDCRHWAKVLHIAASYKGRVFLDNKQSSSAYVLQFANGRRIYCLSSNPNAFAGKRGHVKLDEFALHPDQRLLYQVAKPVTTWGGTLSIISTHRGPNTLFNQIICEIRRDPKASPWHLFSYPLQKAISEGLVERINEKSSRNETREEFEKRIHAECLSEDAWNQEYCCIPADEQSAFISHDLITAAQDPLLKLMTLDELLCYAKSNPASNLYAGLDVARKQHLCVIDVGEKIGEVIHDRLRTELLDQPFAEIRRNLYPILRLPNLRRCCIDNSGIGMETTEEARAQFGTKVEPINFSLPTKERLAFGLRRQFEDHNLRIPIDEKLRADLHGIRKAVTPAGKIQFEGDTDDSHCDRFWAKALRQEAARYQSSAGALVV